MEREANLPSSRSKVVSWLMLARNLQPATMFGTAGAVVDFQNSLLLILYKP